MAGIARGNIVAIFDEQPEILGIYDPDKDNNPYGQPIELDSAQESEIRRDIDRWISDVKGERQALYLEDKWTDGDDAYEGIMEYKDFPFENSSNLNVQVVQEKTEVLKVKGEQQMFTGTFMQCKPFPGDTVSDVERIGRKEAWLNHKLYNEVEIEQYLPPIYHDVYLKGSGIAKIYWDTRVDLCDDVERYSPEDILVFEEKYSDSGSIYYNEAIKKLRDGKEIKIFVSKFKVIWDKARIGWVDLRNLYIKPSIKELYNQRIIPEKIKSTWKDIESGILSGKYPDKIGVLLKEKYGQEESYADKMYDIIESRYWYDYDNRGRKRCIFTYIENEETIPFLEKKTYPYEHNMEDYLLYTFNQRNDICYGDGMYQMLMHINRALNELWNSTIDAGVWANAPTFKAVEDPSNPDPRLKKWGPAMIWWVKNIEQVQQFPVARTSVDMYRFIELMMREGSLVTGVSDYASGKETALDPKAPATKTLALMQEANARISKGIKNIHRMNQKLVEIIDRLYQQFYQIDEESGEDIEFLDKKYSISKQDMFTRCLYIANLSPLTINKSLQHSVNQETIMFLLKVFGPVIMQNPGAIKTMLDIFLQGAPGEWQNYKDKLMPPKGQMTGPQSTAPGAVGSAPVPGAPMPGMPANIEAQGGSQVPATPQEMIPGGV